MTLAKRGQQVFWLPLVTLSYLESLRLATFYAFGWLGRGQALTIVSIIVLLYVYVDYFYPSKFKRFLTGGFALFFIMSVWLVNRAHGPGEYSLLGNIICGLPDFHLGSISTFQYASFCFFVVFLYALIVMLLLNFILEKKSITEMFFAGILLLAIELIASDKGIVGYAIVNVISGIILNSYVYLLQLENDHRVRKNPSWGTGIQVTRWVGILTAALIVTSLITSFLPTGNARVDLATMSNKLAQKVINNRARGDTGGVFGSFWKKMQSFEIQGEIPEDNTPIMYVKSPKPSYWRGESVDFYTGSGWENHTVAKIVSTREFGNPFSTNVAVEKVEQVFSLAAGMSTEVVFNSGNPASVEVPSETLASDEGDNLYTTDLEPGVTYKVSSYVPEKNPQLLKSTAQEYPFNIRAIYLQVPETVPARVKTLTAKLTKGARNPYDKVKTIESYLSSNYPYDLTINTVPENRDVVDYFLFDLKKGYCTYHSTAMVIMLRSIGIPARWVKGFTTGIPGGDTGIYEVTMANAHAWVEVYFADYGWLPFEPTPSFSLPDGSQSGDDAAVFNENNAHQPGASIVSPHQILAREDDTSGVSWVTVSFVLLIITGSAVGIYLWRTRNIFRFGSGDKIRDTYISFINLLAHKGYPKNTAQTPLEYAGSLREVFPEDYADICIITQAYLTDKYGKNKLDAHEVENIRAIWKQLSSKWLHKTRD